MSFLWKYRWRSSDNPSIHRCTFLFSQLLHSSHDSTLCSDTSCINKPERQSISIIAIPYPFVLILSLRETGGIINKVALLDSGFHRCTIFCWNVVISLSTLVSLWHLITTSYRYVLYWSSVWRFRFLKTLVLVLYPVNSGNITHCTVLAISIKLLCIVTLPPVKYNLVYSLVVSIDQSKLRCTLLISSISSISFPKTGKSTGFIIFWSIYVIWTLLLFSSPK